LNVKEETAYVKYHEMDGQPEVLDWNAGHWDGSPGDYRLSSENTGRCPLHQIVALQFLTAYGSFWPYEPGFKTSNNKTI